MSGNAHCGFILFNGYFFVVNKYSIHKARIEKQTEKEKTMKQRVYKIPAYRTQFGKVRTKGKRKERLGINSVVDPDPYSGAFWIRIRIRITV